LKDLKVIKKIKKMVCCEIEISFKDYEKLSLIDSNEKFQIKFKDDKVIICAKNYSSLRAGINAVLKELILLEQINNLEI
jgi:tRNA threonylcarbamoyladenosine modification (KEOPS) complex  Pcc1 subunit